MAFTTSSGYGNLPSGNFAPSIFSQKVLKFFRRASVAEDITNTDYTGEIENFGDTVNIMKEPTLTVSAYTRGSVVNPQDLADDQITMTVDQANAFAFKIDDIEERHSHVNFEALATSSGAYALKRKFDANVLQNLSDAAGIAASAVSGGSGASSVSSSPSISDQIASAQVQTNNVLQSIEILPMPSMDNTPSVVMAEVQVTSMENQIESVTSTMVTSSEAEQIAEEIVANNIRAQQESSQTQQEVSGQYDSQGQSNLIAYMNYVPNFSDYTTANITDQTNWYAPTAIYASATLGDNAGYGNMVSDSMDTLYSIMGQQPVGIFIDRR